MKRCHLKKRCALMCPRGWESLIILNRCNIVPWCDVTSAPGALPPRAAHPQHLRQRLPHDPAGSRHVGALRRLDGRGYGRLNSAACRCLCVTATWWTSRRWFPFFLDSHRSADLLWLRRAAQRAETKAWEHTQRCSYSQHPEEYGVMVYSLSCSQICAFILMEQLTRNYNSHGPGLWSS